MLGDLIRKAQEKKIELVFHEPLSKHTTFRIGGPANLYFIAKSSENLKDFILLNSELKLPLKILGRGSNLLVSDAGIDEVIIHYDSKDISLDLSAQ